MKLDIVKHKFIYLAISAILLSFNSVLILFSFSFVLFCWFKFCGIIKTTSFRLSMYEVFFSKTKRPVRITQIRKHQKANNTCPLKNDVPCLCNMYESENSKRLDEKVLCMFASNEAGWHFMLHLFNFQSPIISIGANIITHIFHFVNTLMNIFLKNGYNM